LPVTSCSLSLAAYSLPLAAFRFLPVHFANFGPLEKINEESST
jgi:hypothetical protein